MTHTRWLSPEERDAWVSLLGVLQQLPAAFDSHLRRTAGLTLTEYYALAMVSDSPSRRIQTKQLAVFTGTTLPRLSRVLSGLQQRGLVTRMPNAQDGRATDIVLTDAGFEQVRRAAPEHVRFVREVVFASQQPGAAAAIHATMTSILAVLDPYQRLPRDPMDLPTAPGAAVGAQTQDAGAQDAPIDPAAQTPVAAAPNPAAQNPAAQNPAAA